MLHPKPLTPPSGFAVTFVSMPPDEELVGIARSFAALMGQLAPARVEHVSATGAYRARVQRGAFEATAEHQDARIALGKAFRSLSAIA